VSVLVLSIEVLVEHELHVTTSDEDREAAATLTKAYAANSEKTSKAVTTQRASSLTPASLQSLRTYLDEYGRQVVDHAVEVRHLVTNKLLEESQNPDPRIRIRALELLGKVSDVGLFTEKYEVTVTHQTTDDLRHKLREKLQKLTRPTMLVPGGVEMDGEIIDVDAELGLGTPTGSVYEPEDGEIIDVDAELGLGTPTGSVYEPEDGEEFDDDNG
jgi:hypothetical protein